MLAFCSLCLFCGRSRKPYGTVRFMWTQGRILRSVKAIHGFFVKLSVDQLVDFLIKIRISVLC